MVRKGLKCSFIFAASEEGSSVEDYVVKIVSAERADFNVTLLILYYGSPSQMGSQQHRQAFS